MAKLQILADRAACLIERYWNWGIKPKEFEIGWGQGPLKISIIRGPGCDVSPGRAFREGTPCH
jgi:hypothetical protein